MHRNLLRALLALLAAAVVSCGSPSAGEREQRAELPQAARIRIASWNVLNLGANTPVAERAQVIALFDICALQEIESAQGLENLRVEVERRTPGITWKAVASPKVGSGGAAEHYAFLFRTDRVQEVPAGPKGLYPEPNPADFSREPFFATFRSGEFDFTLVTIHVTFESPSAITAEVERLAVVWRYVQDLDPKENDVILLGDLNRDKPTHRAFGPLLDGLTLTAALAAGTVEGTTYSTRQDRIWSSWYDHMFIDSRYTGHEWTRHAGVEPIHTRFFQGLPHPHLEVRKKVSDHAPIWAEFRTDGPDDD